MGTLNKGMLAVTIRNKYRLEAKAKKEINKEGKEDETIGLTNLFKEKIRLEATNILTLKIKKTNQDARIEKIKRIIM
jgi:hypothetical protein